MAFTLIQAGGTLKSINSIGAVSSALTLPSGVQLATNRVPRFARFKRYIVVVNTPTRPLSVDTSGVVRVLTPAAPAAAPVLTAGAAGTLSGTYKEKITYLVLDSSGNIISESDYSPVSNTITLANTALTSTWTASADTISAVQLYRTANNGSTFFSYVRSDGNTVVTISNNTPDASLGILEGASLGTAPDLTLIAEWAGRLWGVSRTDVDNLRYTEAGTMYAWYSLNTLPIPHVGSDAAGVTALIPRRAALGVCRRDLFQQITGSSRSNFAPTVVNGGENLGCVSQESVIVFNDVAYFLWRDGVYKWDSNGITSITDGTVRSWFTSDTYFNKAMYWRSFAQLDPTTLKYRLFLASTGSAVIDRWIEYDLTTNTWWGPHVTDAFNPTCAVLVAGDEQQPIMMIGSRQGHLSQDQETKNDWDFSSIALDVETRGFDLAEPDSEKYFGELSVNGKVQTAGTLTITPTVGELENATAGTAFSYTMSNGRQRLGRLGNGKQMSLQFTHDTINQDVELYGFEVDPVTIIGRR